MERAVDVLRDASIWLRSLPQGDSKEKREDLFKKRYPERKPDAVWHKTKEPEIFLETESFEKKKKKKKPAQIPDDEFIDFTRAQEKLREKFESVLAIPAEIKEKFQAKFLTCTTADTDVLETEETRSGQEIDEYDIIELHEHIFVIGGALEGEGNDPTSTVEVFDCTTRTWREIEPLPVQTTACYATAITGKVPKVNLWTKRIYWINIVLNFRWPPSMF